MTLKALKLYGSRSNALGGIGGKQPSRFVYLQMVSTGVNLSLSSIAILLGTNNIKQRRNYITLEFALLLTRQLGLTAQT
jgi:hypothetical protein